MKTHHRRAVNDVNFLAATVHDGQSVPPDSMGAVGPKQFILAVNGRIRSFDKETGERDGVLDFTTDEFFAPLFIFNNDRTSDPRIRYDRHTGRWFMSIASVGGSYGNRVFLAVSPDGVITKSTVWILFYFSPSIQSFCDYPTLGIDRYALYIGCLLFNASTNAMLDEPTLISVVRKESILDQGPIVFWLQTLPYPQYMVMQVLQNN